MDKIFGASAQALQLCEDRAVLITNNITNASTPNYKARDINFREAMQNAQFSLNSQLDKTSNLHMDSSDSMDGLPIEYRIPMQQSLDGNTVDGNLERKSFLENSIRYQVNLTFIQNKTEQITRALNGDQA